MSLVPFALLEFELIFLTGSQEVVGSNPIFSTLEALVSNSRCFLLKATAVDSGHLY